MFGIRLEEVLVNEFTLRKHLELRATMQIEESVSQATSGCQGNRLQKVFGFIRRFFNCRGDHPSLPQEFTRCGHRVS